MKERGADIVAVAGPDGIDARRYHFPGNRPMVRDRTAKTALQMLRYRLLGETFESPLFTAQGGSDATGG